MSAYRCVSVRRGDVGWHKAVFDLCRWLDYTPNDGPYMAMRALTESDTAEMIVALDAETGTCQGAASYRVEGVWIKRINMGVARPGNGAGSAIVAEIIARHPDKPQWCKSVPEANEWCSKLGMMPVGGTEQGWTIYVWPVSVMQEWARGHI